MLDRRLGYKPVLSPPYISVTNDSTCSVEGMEKCSHEWNFKPELAVWTRVSFPDQCVWNGHGNETESGDNIYTGPPT